MTHKHLSRARHLAGALPPLLLALHAQAQVGPGLARDLTIDHDGLVRTYDVYVPSSYSGAEAVPLVVDSHGLTADSDDQRNRSGFQQLADDVGFIVAFPNGRGGLWNDGLTSSTSDDIGFIVAMVDQLSSEANIDAHRVYATGFSAGGSVTHRLACEATDIFAAFASFASSVPTSWSEATCAASRPFSLMTTRGTTDQVVPFGGGTVLNLGSVISANAAFEFWADLNECVGAEPDRTTPLGGSSMCSTYTQCASQAQIRLCSVESVDADGHNVYQNQDSVDLASLAWEFMSQFELPAAGPGFELNFGLSGGWFNPETNGQGLLIEVLPTSQQVFATWFTYAAHDASGVKIGSSDHRWLSGLGTIDGNRVEIDLQVTSGGFFDDPSEVTRTPPDSVGTLILEFQDCANATMSYNMPDENLSGSRSLVRLAAPPDECADPAQSR